MRILIIEDDAETAAYLVKGLSESGHRAERVGDGKDGLFRALEEDFDALVVDRMLPGLDGLALIRSLRAAGRKTPALFLSALGEVDDRVEGLRAGGDDYLVKPFAFSELLARLEALLRRGEGEQAPRTVLKVADLVLDPVSMRATRAGTELQLSPIGLRLLTILMRESPRVVSRQEIEREIWGNGLPDSDTLRSHLYNLRKTIDKPFDKQLLHTVQSAGYRVADISQPPE